MDRRAFLVAISAGVAAAPFAVEAQQSTRTARVGFLAYEPFPAYESSFNSALHRLGWEEGRNLMVERRYAQSSVKLVEAAAELTRLAPDVIIASNAGLAKIVRQETTSIPIVVLVAGDLVVAGLVESLARPGGNVTGIQIVQHELLGKRLQLLKEAVGDLSRIAALGGVVTVDVLALQVLRNQFETMARTLGMTAVWHQVRDVGELEDRFKTMAVQYSQGLIVVGSPFTFSNARAITELAAHYRIPATYEARVFVVGGGLMSYGVDFAAAFARGAAYVDKILRGTKPADLPVEQPTKFEFVINLKIATALGLTLPQSLLLRADHVIQ